MAYIEIKIQLLKLHRQVFSIKENLITYREADLCDSSWITEKVFISIVHKAKGLEIENVIIFEAVNGVYSSFGKNTPKEIRESERMFYIAMTWQKTPAYHIRRISVRNIQMRKSLLYQQRTYRIPTPYKEIISFWILSHN